MASLSDPAASRAILIGVGEYVVLDDLPAVRNNLTALKAALTSPAIWGLPEQNCVVLYQPSSTQAVLDSVDQVSGEATDTLVVYFSGHGLVDPEDDEELLLALPGSDIQRAYRTAVPYAWLRRGLRAARARRKVVILDCCYSGRALGWMGDEQNELASRAEIEGTCVLTSAARTRRALAPPGERFTAFTGELITTLNAGVADGPLLLDMDTVYQHLAARLRAKNMPTPQRGELDSGGNIAIAVNRAATAGQKGRGRAVPDEPSEEIGVAPYFQAARGVAVVAELIARTLGPAGRSCVIRDRTDRDIEAFDAETIAGHFVAVNPRDKLGVSYVSDIVRDQHQMTPDGAAIAVVLAHAMVQRAVNALDGQANPASLIRGMGAARDKVVAELGKLGRDLESKQELNAVISAAVFDSAIGKMVAEAFDKVGKDGFIGVEPAENAGLELVLNEGMIIDGGYVTGDFVTDFERGEAVLEEPLILMVDSRLSKSRELVPIIDKVASSGSPLVVLAEDVQDGALDALIDSKVRGACETLAVRVSGDEDDRRSTLSDTAILTGGRFIDRLSVFQLGQVDLPSLGRARKVVASRDDTVIVDGAGDTHSIMGRINHIRGEISDSHSQNDRERLQMRLAKLAGGTATLRIGHVTGISTQRRIAKAKLGIKIGHESIDYGVVPGGGAALSDVRRRLGNLDSTFAGMRPGDETTGMLILLESLTEPLKRIAANAGFKEATADEAIISWEEGVGIDALTGEAGKMSPRILDISSVLQNAVINATSLAVRVILLA